ncbi:glycosyltransferase [Streptomyces sp. NL15-2K]|uniref:glycosyltransferase n=1 Tax=Streptomyces sp. NL15-2K TaxID=376149 RepID=UPI000F5783A3|nr:MULTISPECIES: hypothetical protein [Actinomycetes]WKX11337.1 hypothetical protein Q4V64_29005 [Kutzneria buriramensis]GCB47254.1 zeaxanthin glucosyl transferase [Streptomyces sp. NL15-2K]
MKALLFPWHIGAGHLGRLIEIGKLLDAHAGCRSLVCRDGVAEPLSGVSGAGPGPRAGRVSADRRYLVVPDVEHAWSQAGYYNVQRVRRDVARDAALIRQHRPALVVTHMQPTAVLAARQAGVPVLSIADGDFLTDEEWGWMSWARGTGLRAAPYPPCLAAFDAVGHELGLDPLPHASDLNWGDRTLVASVPSVDPAPPPAKDGTAAALHCGPLIWADGTPPADPGTAAPGKAKVYVSLGSGELWPGQVDDMLTDVARELDALVYRSSPRGTDADSQWLRHTDFGTLTSHVTATDITVTHGGHSTVHAALCAGRPVLVAPFMSENEANGRVFLEDTDAGRCLWHTEVRNRRLTFVDDTGKRHDSPPLDARHLASGIDAILSDPSYATAAHRLSRELAAYKERQVALVTAAVQELGV